MDRLQAVVSQLIQQRDNLLEQSRDLLALNHVVQEYSEPVKATDQSGAVTVLMRGIDVPDSITVAENWKTRGVVRVDSAIMEAISVATAATWNYAANYLEEVDDDEYDEYVRRTQDEIGINTPEPSSHEWNGRPLSEAFELQQESFIRAQSFSGTRSVFDPEKMVTFTVTRQALTECVIDQDWARNVNPRTLNNIIADTLLRAHHARDAIVDEYDLICSQQAAAGTQAIAYLHHITAQIAHQIGSEK